MFVLQKFVSVTEPKASVVPRNVHMHPGLGNGVPSRSPILTTAHSCSRKEQYVKCHCMLFRTTGLYIKQLAYIVQLYIVSQNAHIFFF